MAQTITFDPCEPFQAFNRIEGRPRQEELDDALAAKVHDPLWMLARQYQFGEFQGEDAGSATFAKVALNTVKMTGFINGNQPEVPMDDSIPLETTVERLIPEMDNKTALRLGKKFLQLFDEMGSGVQGYSAKMYNTWFYQRFTFNVPSLDRNQNKGQLAANARSKSLQQSMSFVRAISGRAINARELWTFLGRKKNRMNQLIIKNSKPAKWNRFILDEHKDLAKNVAQAWITYVINELNLPDNEDVDCWNPKKLEYAFETTIKEGNGVNGKTTLQAEEYYHGHLDWYSFDVKTPNPSTNKNFNENIRKREVLAVIPAEAAFAGMPNSRWWQMEDGSIDLGNLKASDTDIAKILVSQYALQYSNDWLSIPYDVPTGSFTEVEGIVVTDTFGRKTLVEAAHKDDGEDWNAWNMYSLTISKGEFEEPDFDKRMLLPPAVTKIQESDPVEEVKFIRDEMANLVWGIESIVPNGLGYGVDGYEANKNFSALIEQLTEVAQVPNSIALPVGDPNVAEAKATTYKPQLKYMLGNSVSENWIPFMAVHKSGSNREIDFQRASMPRITEWLDPHAIRPRTQLLRVGIDQNDNQLKPYFLNEEEVPRCGVIVKGTYQRARWYNGKVVTWYGRRKRTGRGEGSSGLRFDLVLDNK